MSGDSDWTKCPMDAPRDDIEGAVEGRGPCFLVERVLVGKQVEAGRIGQKRTEIGAS